MYEAWMKAVIGQHQNIVLLGEAGSGKSELALNLAEILSKTHPDKKIHIFDLDQTKVNFRIRDLKTEPSDHFTIHFNQQIMDSPTQVGGVEGALADENCYAILDVGGGAMGALQIGRFSDLLNDALVLYLINPYRPWSDTAADMKDTMCEILCGTRLSHCVFIANPNVGLHSTAEDVLTGYQKIRHSLGIAPVGACVLNQLADTVEGQLDIPVLPIRIRLTTSCPEKM